MTQEPSTLFLRRIPKDLKHKFKIWCVRNNVSMTEKIIDLMKEAIKSDSKK